MPSPNPFNAADWSVTLAGTPIPWCEIELTLEQFHIPARFAVTAPLQAIDVPLLLTDTPPEVVISYRGTEYFVGELEESEANGNQGGDEGDMPGDLLTFHGRDLSARFARTKVTSSLPLNQTASEMVRSYCQQAGFTDLSGIQNTTDQIGTFLKQNYHYVTQRLTVHDVLFELAEHEGFVFRVHKRKPFFGPQPNPAETRKLAYMVDFNQYTWRKSHTNKDVTVHVLGWTGKRRISATAGQGDLVVTKFLHGDSTVMTARAIANNLLLQLERDMLRMDMQAMPGDPTLDDILFAFNVGGIAKGVDQVFWPSRIYHHVSQDFHDMNLELYNAKRILA